MNRQVNLPVFPKRIISLVPSQTELLFDLELQDRIVGITKFCIHPKEKCKNATVVGGTKNFDFEIIKALNPDLIIGNKEENEEHQIKALMELYPVWMSDIQNLNQALDMIQEIGKICNKQKQAFKLSNKIKLNFEALKIHIQSFLPKKTAYLIWRKPYMAAGNNTFINNMLGICKLENVFQQQTSRYPEIAAQVLKNQNPELILLSSEPFPFKEKHIKELKDMLPEAKIQLVDGEMFSWYGSRLKKAAGYFKNMIDAL